MGSIMAGSINEERIKKSIGEILDKIQDEEKVLVFGKNIDPFFDKKVGKYPNAFYLGVFSE
jgi:hypothetical protein